MLVTLPSGTLRFEHVGNTEGQPVLLVMGFGLSGRAWFPQIEGLSPDHSLLWFDNHGIGDSTAPPPHSFADAARDVVTLLDHAGLESAHVVGVSMGGMLAQWLAIAAPSRVRSLTLIATHPGGSVRHGFPTLRGLRHFLAANTLKGQKRLDALARLLYPQEFLDAQMHAGRAASVDDDLFSAFTTPASAPVLFRQLACIARHDTNEKLRALTHIPTMIVKPERDVLVPPSNSDRLHRAMPHATLISFPDAGHGVTFQCKDLVNQHLRAHFRSADEQTP